MSAIENLTATTLRNIIGDLELDQSLTSRDHINTQMRAILDEATDPWGIKVNRVELKNIMPPRDIQESMEKQMRAERERRESILQAEGQKQSQILVAEGEKQAAILRADAAKQAALRRQAAVWRFLSSDVLPALRRVDLRIDYGQDRIVEVRTRIARPAPRPAPASEPRKRCCCAVVDDGSTGFLVEMPEPDADF